MRKSYPIMKIYIIDVDCTNPSENGVKERGFHTREEAEKWLKDWYGLSDDECFNFFSGGLSGQVYEITVN